MPDLHNGQSQHGERAVRATPRALPDWDAARLFLAVVRKGSLRAAADSVGLSVNAVRSRLSNLEHTLKATLFTRNVAGTQLTLEGQTLLAAAERMEAASFEILRARDQVGPDVSGEVRLAVTEGLGTYWIAPRLIEFQRENPKLLIDLNCCMKAVDMLRLEADVAVQLTRPSANDLVVVKLGRLHFRFFAAKSYIEAHGCPKDLTELAQHKILIQSDDNAQWFKCYDRFFPGIPPVGLVSIRTNVSSALFWSLVRGSGIGLLPTYAHIIGAPIAPLEIEVPETLDIWLTYHPAFIPDLRVRRREKLARPLKYRLTL